MGVTDPSNLTEKVYRLAKKASARYPHMHFTFVVGIGYDHEAHGVVSCEKSNITVVQNAKFVSSYMRNADMAFTSQGRTVYELAVLGVPAIVLAQNEERTTSRLCADAKRLFQFGAGVPPGRRNLGTHF